MARSRRWILNDKWFFAAGIIDLLQGSRGLCCKFSLFRTFQRLHTASYPPWHLWHDGTVHISWPRWESGLHHCPEWPQSLPLWAPLRTGSPTITGSMGQNRIAKDCPCSKFETGPLRIVSRSWWERMQGAKSCSLPLRPCPGMPQTFGYRKSSPISQPLKSLWGVSPHC